MGRAGAIEISLEQIRRVRERDRSVVTHTPVAPSAHLSERCGGSVVLKAENLQRTGAFKIRGVMNKLAVLGDRARKGVVAGSAGNHAQALAFGARHFGVPCEIFVPAGASLAKMAACRGYGATVHEGGDSLDIAVARAKERAQETGMVFCHPYDDPDVVTGQATLGIELIEDIPDLAQVIVPLGGGGLLSGVALAVKQFDPAIRVIGVQISSCAPYVYGTAPTGPVPTLADGIAVKVPGDVTAPLIDKWVDEIVDVDEDSVADAMMLLLERAKFFVEGGGAVGVSALITGRVKPAERGATCVVLSGGNADLGLLTGLVRRHETNRGRRLIVFARISDRPGGLARLLTLFANHGANLIEVEHVREGVDLRVRETGVQVVLEVRGRDHAESLIAGAKADGYEISAVSGR
jgi:threonine dehydratase